MRLIVFAFAVAIAVSGCTTMNFKVYKYESGLGEADIELSLTDSPWSYVISNNTDKDITLSPGKSSFVLNGESNRVVTGESKVIKSDAASTDLPIGPKSKKTVLFVPPELIRMEFKKGKWEMEWLRKLSDGDKIEFRFAFLGDDGKVIRKSIAGKVNEFSTKVTDTNRVACYASGIIYGGWCWFLPTSGDLEKGKKEAQEKFGEKLLIEQPTMGL